MKMKCWDKMMTPMRKVWAKFSKKIGLRKTAGHVKLQQHVSTCEYEDVHVLWEMLKRNETDLTNGKSGKKGPFWEFVQWAKHTPLICRAANNIVFVFLFLGIATMYFVYEIR